MMGRRFTKRRAGRWLVGGWSLARLLKLRDRDRDDLVAEAQRRIDAGDYEGAERLYELLGVLWPDAQASALLGRGVCRQLQGDLDGAERAYDEVLQAEPRNVYALTNRAEVRLLTQRKEAALADLSEASAALGKNAKALRERLARLQERSRSAS